MKSAGFLSTLGVGLCVVAFAAFFLAPIYQPMFSNRLTFLWTCLMASDFNWFFFPEEWRASETVKTFFDSFNTSFLPINRWSILLIAAIESLWIYSFGSLIFRVLKNPLEESPLLRFCLTCLTGAAALSTLTGFLGLIGCLQSWLFWTLAIIQLALGVFLLIRNWSKLPRWRVPTTAYCLLPTALIALFCLLAVLPAMTPSWDFDVREYHLESVKEFWLSGRITALPNNAYANMPLGAESLVLVSMALSGDWFLGALAGKTLLSLSVPLTALLLFSLGEKYLSKRAGLIGAFIYVSTPLVISNAQHGLIDNALTMYALATAAVLLEIVIRNSELREDTQISCELRVASCENRQATNGSGFGQSRVSADWERRLAASQLATIAGAMAGMAAAIKYPGALFVALPCFIAIFWKSSRLRLQIPVVAFLLTALLFGGVWYLKNAILLGNPVYPLCSSLFGSEFPVGFSAESYARWQTVHAPHGWTWSAISSPIAFFFYSSSAASPLFLPVLACCLLLWKRLPNYARWSLIYSGLFLIGWHVTTHRIERFLLPIVPFIALAGGAVFDVVLSSVSVLMGRILKGVLVLSAAYSLLILALPLFGLGTLESISDKRSSPIRLGEGLTQLVTLKSEELLKMKNSGERVLLIGDAAVFDWPVPIDYAVCFNSDDFIDSVTSKLQGDNPPKFIVVNMGELDRYWHTEYGYCTKTKEAVLDILDNPDRFTPIYRSGMMTTIYEYRQ
ncbi:MAG: hypothetical protein IKS45_06940 [Thermoguttaceae bacterium]|nr:hypothetical protein [Thermoguttaceae bacterium]